MNGAITSTSLLLVLSLTFMIAVLTECRTSSTCRPPNYQAFYLTCDQSQFTWVQDALFGAITDGGALSDFCDNAVPNRTSECIPQRNLNNRNLRLACNTVRGPCNPTGPTVEITSSTFDNCRPISYGYTYAYAVYDCLPAINLNNAYLSGASVGSSLVSSGMVYLMSTNYDSQGYTSSSINQCSVTVASGTSLSFKVLDLLGQTTDGSSIDCPYTLSINSGDDTSKQWCAQVEWDYFADYEFDIPASTGSNRLTVVVSFNQSHSSSSVQGRTWIIVNGSRSDGSPVSIETACGLTTTTTTTTSTTTTTPTTTPTTTTTTTPTTTTTTPTTTTTTTPTTTPTTTTTTTPTTTTTTPTTTTTTTPTTFTTTPTTTTTTTTTPSTTTTIPTTTTTTTSRPTFASATTTLANTVLASTTSTTTSTSPIIIATSRSVTSSGILSTSTTSPPTTSTTISTLPSSTSTSTTVAPSTTVQTNLPLTAVTPVFASSETSPELISLSSPGYTVTDTRSGSTSSIALAGVQIASNNTVAIAIGVSVAGVVLLCIIVSVSVCICVYCLKKKKKKQSSSRVLSGVTSAPVSSQRNNHAVHSVSSTVSNHGSTLSPVVASTIGRRPAAAGEEIYSEINDATIGVTITHSGTMRTNDPSTVEHQFSVRYTVGSPTSSEGTKYKDYPWQKRIKGRPPQLDEEGAWDLPPDSPPPYGDKPLEQPSRHAKRSKWGKSKLYVPPGDTGESDTDVQLNPLYGMVKKNDKNTEDDYMY